MSLEFEKPLLEIEEKIAELKALSAKTHTSFDTEIAELDKRCQVLRQDIYAGLTPWQTLQVARHPERPVLQDYIALIFDDFAELHGDRNCWDDRGLIGGFASIEGRKVMLFGHNKGKTPEQNAERNFGMARPEGYRKALRLMKLAEQCGIPVISFIDTPGAYPGLEAEERGQAEAIARNLTEMSLLQTPIICAVTGEGGSGGALGIGVGDVVMMLSYSVYGVISPEGCAGILWRDASFAPQAAEAMRITAPSLLELGAIDEIIAEPAGGAHRNYELTAEAIKAALLNHLKSFDGIAIPKLIKKRFEKYSNIGIFETR